jgi:hypothetical protein
MNLLSPEEMASVYLNQTTPDNSVYNERSLIIVFNFIINVRGK